MDNEAVEDFKESYEKYLNDKSFAGKMLLNSLDSLAYDSLIYNEARREVIIQNSSSLQSLTKEEIHTELKKINRKHNISELKRREKTHGLEPHERDLLRIVKMLIFVLNQ